MNVWAHFGERISIFLRESSGLFVPTGEALVLSFMLIGLVMAALEIQAGASPAFLPQLFFKFSLAGTFVSFYNTEIPLIGFSFLDMIILPCQWVATRIDDETVNQALSRIHALQLQYDVPVSELISQGISSFLNTGLTILVLKAMEVVTICITALGPIGVAVGAIFGPILIPFMLFPPLYGLWSGFLHYMIQYAAYISVASAYLLVMANYFNWAFAPMQMSSISESAWTLGQMHLIIYGCTFLFGSFKIPAMTAGLFSGRAGESAGIQNIIPFVGR